MKQHITLDQWKALSPNAQFLFHGGVVRVENSKGCTIDGCWDCHQAGGLPAIGQILAFLSTTDCHSYTHWIDVGNLDHRIQGEIEKIGEPLVTVGWSGRELIDSLWNEVIRVLEPKGQGGL